MTFYEWLQAWIVASKNRRDMWGPFAHWLGNYSYLWVPAEAGLNDFGVIASCFRLEVGEVKRFMLAEVYMTYEHHVTPDEWERIDRDTPPPAIHPCNSWLADVCDCHGNCSCHWKQTVISEDGPPVEITDLKGDADEG